MTIPDKLKIIQQLLKLTQTELATRLGISFPTLNSWINGKSTPHARKVKIIDEFYQQTTQQKIIPGDKVSAKQQIILQKSEANINVLEIISNRPDIHDQLVLSFTYNTNSIEGSTLTENETAAIIFQNITLKNKDLIEHLEAKNHQFALDYLFSKISKNFKISEIFIMKLNKILMNGIRQDAGSYRSHGVRIVGANVPTANYLKVPDLMKSLILRTNEKSKNIVSEVAAVHSEFEQIHPFSDGNGRIGRLIMAAMLLRADIAPAVIKKQKKHLYYKALQKSQQKGDLEELTDFICDAILNGFEIIEG